ncbi:MAG TPA: hypothetical protein VHF45_00920, partial [Thermoleophilaceae bacterium]|nr:hypothetical protein [Thermoleophilaceae bacterium]
IDFRPSFVDGAGSPHVLPEMFERVRELIDGAFTASLGDHAGALAPAAALAGSAGAGKVVCVVSGGNIDLSTLGTVLAGETP